MFGKFNIVQFPVGNVGVQMGGWYRKEINSVEDLQGLKFRIGGIGGAIDAKLGAVPQQIPPAEIYTSLEKGLIDGAEWMGRTTTRSWASTGGEVHLHARLVEGSAQVTLLVNQKAWGSLPKAYKDTVESAAAEQYLMMMAKYDAGNPAALKRLVGGGARSALFRARCSTPATRRRRRCSASSRRRVPSSRISTSPGSASATTKTSGPRRRVQPRQLPLRREMSGEEKSGQGVGARVPRKEDARHLHGRGTFVPDLILPGQREVAFLRSR